MNEKASDASSSKQTALHSERPSRPKEPDVPHDNTAENQRPEVKIKTEIKAEENEGANLMDFPTSRLEENENLPSTVTDISKHQFHRAQANKEPMYLVGTITQRLTREKRDLEVEFPGAQEALMNLLSCLRLLATSDTFSAKDEDDLKIRYILTTLMGENPRARGPYAYPWKVQLEANALLGYVNERLPTVELALGEVEEAEGSTSRQPPRKRQRTNTQEQQPPLAVSQGKMKEVMRGIDISTAGRRTYSITDKSIVRSSKVVGDNGIPVGTWWPLRICALRDGAHGATVAGISGSIDDGAYSIVVASQYADLDKDFGDKIHYSGSKSLENADPVNPIMTSSTRSLQTSKREDRSVRVIRAAGGNPDYSPSSGFRYDGLYKIIEERLPMNKKGGCYVRFTLQRKDGQPDIDKSRPNKEERAIFSRLKEF